MKPNILLVVLDATRADRCTTYGYERPTTPVLNALAAEGTLFENAFAVAPWTMPSFASLLTGRYPSELGIYEMRRLTAQLPTLPEVLSAVNYSSMVATNNSWVSESFGLTRGFQQIIKLWQLIQTQQDLTRLVLTEIESQGSIFNRLMRSIRYGNPLYNIVNIIYGRVCRNRVDYGAKRLNHLTQSWIAVQKKPWLVVSHYLEAHLEYRPPRKQLLQFVRHLGIAQQLLAANQIGVMLRHIAGIQPLSPVELETWSDLYDAELNYQDTCLGDLLAWLRQTGQLDNTVVIVTADHGENLGEHGLLNHQYCLYDTLLHVPLVIRYPAMFPAGQRIKTPVTLLDVFATILAVSGGDMTVNKHGISLANEAELADRLYTLAEYGMPRPPDESFLANFGIPRDKLLPLEKSLTAIRSQTHKLITDSNGSMELYSWFTDPSEMDNLACQRPDLVDALLLEMNHYLTLFTSERNNLPIENVSGVDPESMTRLRDLGYID